MTQWGLDTLFNPAKRHMDEEKRRLQSTREEVGDNSGGRRIDLESGKVVIRKADDEATEDNAIGNGAADGAADNAANKTAGSANNPADAAHNPADAAHNPADAATKKKDAAPSAAAQRAAARRGRTAR